MTLDVLRKIGVSDGEMRVYRVLLRNGRSAVNTIHEKTGIERRNIYDILNKLIERGFVTYVTQNKKRYFTAAHPRNILGYIDEKKDDLERTKQQVEAELPAIIAAFQETRPAVNAEIFRGADGVKAVWEDSLSAKQHHWIGSGRYIPKQYPHFFRSWNRRRIQKKIRWFNLVRAELRGETPYVLEHVRFLPKEFSGNPTVIFIYGDKVVNFLYGAEFFAFVIESRELAENYRRYHKYLWENVAKK